MIQSHSSHGSKTLCQPPLPSDHPPTPNLSCRVLNFHQASPSSLALAKPQEPLGIPHVMVNGTRSLPLCWSSEPHT